MAEAIICAKPTGSVHIPSRPYTNLRRATVSAAERVSKVAVRERFHNDYEHKETEVIR